MIVFASVMLAIVMLMMLLYLRAEVGGAKATSTARQQGWRDEYEKRKTTDPVSSELFALIDRLDDVSVTQHTEWLTNCIEEFEANSEKAWESRDQFIQQGVGVVCWAENEGMAAVMNKAGHYEMICEFLKREPVEPLLREIEAALDMSKEQAPSAPAPHEASQE